MKKLFLPLSLLLLGFIGGCENQGKRDQARATPNEILIGHVDSFTGSQATFGISDREGIQLGISIVNSAGGIGGKKVRLIAVDDQGKPEKSREAIERLITKDKVVAVLGASASSRSLEMAPVAQQFNIPMISPSSTNPKVTEVGNYIFRVCFIDTFQGPVMARFLRETLKAKTVALLRDVESEYSLGLAQFFKDKFVKMGGRIVADQTYHAGDIDFKSQMTAIASHKPEVIYIPGYYTDVANIIVQAKNLGIKAVFAGGDGWDSNELYEIGGNSLDASYFTNHYSPNSKEPVHVKFAADYKATFKAPLNADSALGYDAVMVLLEAMKRAKSLSGPDLRNAIASTKNFQGVTGKITIDEKRNAVKSAVIFKVQGKKSVYVQTIAP